MSPFDPNPRLLEPAQNGFIWCEACQAPRQLPHVCSPAVDWKEVASTQTAAMVEVFYRAEFAESLLCAMAFDHGRDRFTQTDVLDADWVTMNFEWPLCDSGCAFCEAAR